MEQAEGTRSEGALTPARPGCANAQSRSVPAVHWSLHKTSSFYQIRDNSVTQSKPHVRMGKALQRVAEKLLRRSRVPRTAFADEAHAQRMCRRCAVSCTLLRHNFLQPPPFQDDRI